MKHPLRILITGGLLAFMTVSAEAETVQSSYSVSLYGLTLARMQFNNKIDGDAFEVKGKMSSAGVAAILDDTNGTVSTKGSFSGQSPQPSAYRTEYTTDGKDKMTEIAFKGGNVVSAVNKPEVKTKRKSWVPTRPGDLDRVADPLSALMVRTDDARKVCGRTLRVFDGATRADLALSYSSMRKVSIKGYRGDAVVCDAKFIPVSGYRKTYKSIQYMKDSSGIIITFAPIGSTGVYAPLGASIGTPIGTITVQANRFQTVE